MNESPGRGGASRRRLDVAVDFKGNFYEADSFNSSVRGVDSAGKINTLAGTGRGFYNGNGPPATAANMQPAGY